MATLKKGLVVRYIPKWLGMVILATLCVAVLLGLGLSYRELRVLRQEKLVQQQFAACAEQRRKVLSMATQITREERERQEAAIALLSNGVFDQRVLIMTARVVPLPLGARQSDHPCHLEWYAVDELTQVAWIGYSATNDPNAFGAKLFTISEYYSVVRYAGSPKFFWGIPVTPYRAEWQAPAPETRLTSYGHGVSSRKWGLGVSVGEWNSLVSNRGQLILRDSNLKELDRLQLSPSTDEETNEILKSLILANSNMHGEPNFAPYPNGKSDF